VSGHGGWVTSLMIGEEKVEDGTQEFLVTGSRGKKGFG
jgi:hypothetical protein